MIPNRRCGTIVAIDPDIGKNGVATINRETRFLSATCKNFPETLEYLKDMSVNAPKPFVVYIEAGWMNKGNWHITESRNGHFSPQAWAAAVGAGTGECHAVSKKLLECCEFYHIPATPVKPLRKCWKGKDRKITHEELLNECAIYRVGHKLGGRSNQEERDAALIALVNL